MSLIDYHSMTLDEPSNSPARRQQYLVICSVMAGMFVYTLLTSGIIDSIKIIKGTFPGGTYMYKNSTRDYAAALGLMDEIANSYNLSKPKYNNLLYTTYLDDPLKVGGSEQRMASGFLMSSKNNKKDKKYEPQVTPKDRLRSDPTRLQEFQQQAYQFQDVPQVPASVATFPHSLGFVSALIVSYKIIPALRNHAIEQHSSSSPVVWMTCDPKEKMCTFYAPHVTTQTANKYKAFWLGRDTADIYAQSCSSGLEAVVDLQGVKDDFVKVVTYPYKFLFGNNSDDDNKKKDTTDEL